MPYFSFICVKIRTMKKTIFTLLLLTVSLSYGQNFYNFTTSQSTYANLVAPTSLNNGAVWDFDEFGPVSIPFSFSIYGQAVNQFLFYDDDFVFLTPNADLEEETGVFYCSVSGAFIQDRTTTSTSASAISYTTEGEAGDRILMLEVKNAGLENDEPSDLDENHFYLNFQVWLYERGNIIEFRYGDHNITDIAVLDNEVYVGLYNMPYVSVLTGSITQPEYLEFDLDNNPPDDNFDPLLDAFPTSGTVYRFAPASTMGIDTYNKKTFTIYPNPTQANLHIVKTDGTANYEVYSILGSKVLSGTIDTTNTNINVANLDKGVYLLKIGNAVQKFIKK